MSRFYSLDMDASLEKRDLFTSLVYGPVRSRRLGLSLGVNPLPLEAKLCSFNCPYCQFGWTDIYVGNLAEAPVDAFPSVEEVAYALEETLRKLAKEGKGVDSITFAGNGEPTLHPQFLELVKAAIAQRDRLMPKARISILTNGSTLNRPHVIQGLNMIDERMVKLDAGDIGSVRDINLPHPSFDLEGMISSISTLTDCVLQSMFVRGRIDNTTQEVVEAWIERVGQITPQAVQVYSIDRVPADGSLEVVPEDTLRAIASCCQARTGVPCEVY
jgi:wyosine [tRNA(Phe)-imidazoG37] synthetase (radical SAM superfamily)